MASIEIKVDVNAMTLGDLEIIDKAQRKEANLTELLDLLDRVVVGGARHLPLTALDAIVEKLQEQIGSVTNPL